jgi:hypothetical protein
MKVSTGGISNGNSKLMTPQPPAAQQNIHISPHVVIIVEDKNNMDDLIKKQTKVLLDKLPEVNRKLNKSYNNDTNNNRLTFLESIYFQFISFLLIP